MWLSLMAHRSEAATNPCIGRVHTLNRFRINLISVHSSRRGPMGLLGRSKCSIRHPNRRNLGCKHSRHFWLGNRGLLFLSIAILNPISNQRHTYKCWPSIVSKHYGNHSHQNLENNCEHRKSAMAQKSMFPRAFKVSNVVNSA